MRAYYFKGQLWLTHHTRTDVENHLTFRKLPHISLSQP